MRIFSCGKTKKKLAEILLKNGIYRLEHELEMATVVNEEVVSIGKLHKLLGHISPEVARSMVQKGVVEGFKLDDNSTILSCELCEYGKAHHKVINKE